LLTLLEEWMLTCDRPFDEAEKAEFIAPLKVTREHIEDIYQEIVSIPVEPDFE
jgi:hypothetical protein